MFGLQFLLFFISFERLYRMLSLNFRNNFLQTFHIIRNKLKLCPGFLNIFLTLVLPQNRLKELSKVMQRQITFFCLIMTLKSSFCAYLVNLLPLWKQISDRRLMFQAVRLLRSIHSWCWSFDLIFNAWFS